MNDRIVVLCGGASGERRVSVASAQNIVATLADAVPWFVTPEGAVYEVTREALLAHQRPFELDFTPSGAPKASSLDGALEEGATYLLALHGVAGEDGTVQALLAARGLAYTGSDEASSRRAFDKNIAKNVLSQAGVAVAASETVASGDPGAIESALGRMLAAHGRVVAKPVADGSSVGLFHVGNAADALAAARAIASAGVAYLVEAFVAGPELTIAVVDMGSGAEALCASEVRLDPGRAFDYDGKYLGRGTVELTPAHVPDAVARAACEVAVRAHVALGCAGYSRTDVIATERGPVFLETNTLPGLTRASFVPQQLAHRGIALEAFLRAQVGLARSRHPHPPG